MLPKDIANLNHPLEMKGSDETNHLIQVIKIGHKQQQKGYHLKCQLLNSLQWPIYIINSVDNAKFILSHQPNTTVSSETYLLYLQTLLSSSFDSSDDLLFYEM